MFSIDDKQNQHKKGINAAEAGCIRCDGDIGTV
jgi:hypothetical protein